MIAKPHALLTIVAPLPLSKLSQAEAEIDKLQASLPSLEQALRELDPDGFSSTHFMSLHAIASTDGETAYLLFELSGDGTTEAALDRLVRDSSVKQAFRRVFLLASDWTDGGELLSYWRGHLLTTGSGYSTPPGLGFVGAPGMTVGRIRDEAGLAAHVTSLLRTQPGDLPALTRLGDVREKLSRDNKFSHFLKPADTSIAFSPASAFGAALKVGLLAANTYLWPLYLLVLGIAGGYGAWRAGTGVDLADWIRQFASGAFQALWVGLLVGLLVTVVGLIAGYSVFRAAEARDPTDDRAADRNINAAMFANENKGVQNHMISITRRKPGLLRAFTSRLVFLVIGGLATWVYPPGFLSTIGSIHFARWITPKGSRDLVFLSNYDGSWESYLEDFITLAHEGLTAVWSNTIGFPATQNLFQGGATDGERFKRFARRSMIPSRFWYSAYPDLTVQAIRRNAAIRRGLSGAMNEDEASEWLSLFGSARRPDSKLVSSEIQSLVFGGMKFLPFGTCLVFEQLPDSPARARAFLAQLYPLIAFNDGRLVGDCAVTLSLGPRGLSRLGLPNSALETFPFAFLEGMTGGNRTRILGDHDTNDPKYWRWGRGECDMSLLVYGKTQPAVAALELAITGYAEAVGLAPPHSIPLSQVTDDKREPFGFVDGISQPVIRGTYKSLRGADPIHLVEPGEFILGYPDNRGNLPPGPVIAAIEDPQNLLPLAVRSNGFDRNNAPALRDLGCNGSFLVIRELEQDKGAFDAYCDSEAARLQARLAPPYRIDRAFIAAKMLGRWPDGSSLVRHPYEPRSANSGLQHDTIRPKAVTSDNASPVEPPAHSVQAGRMPFGDNDYLFGTEDPEAIRCPFGAHVRRANPRDSLSPGSADQIAISNRHRILRVGRNYEPKQDQNPGLLFMCLNGDIERQFEFLQQTWLRSPVFHGLSCERDPILGDAQTGTCGYTIPSRDGPVSLKPVPQFVTVRGGGYFFLPSKRLLEYLMGLNDG